MHWSIDRKYAEFNLTHFFSQLGFHENDALPTKNDHFHQPVIAHDSFIHCFHLTINDLHSV